MYLSFVFELCSHVLLRYITKKDATSIYGYGIGSHVASFYMAKSFYFLSPWENAGLCFQRILKSISSVIGLRVNYIPIGHYTSMRK